MIVTIAYALSFGIMMQRVQSFRFARVTASLVLVISVTVIALVVNAPKAQQNPTTTPAGGKSIPTIRLEVFDRLAETQACLDQGDTSCAVKNLDELSGMADLNAYETGQIQNLYAFAYLERGESAAAISAYETIISLPQDNLPDRLVGTATRNLATLYLEADRLDEGLALYEQWFELPYITPSPYDHYLKASVLYRLDRHEDAVPELRQAIDGGTETFWRESAYELLYALQISTDDLVGARRTLEVLNSRWPKPQWAEALELFERGVVR